MPWKEETAVVVRRVFVWRCERLTVALFVVLGIASCGSESAPRGPQAVTIVENTPPTAKIEKTPSAPVHGAVVQSLPDQSVVPNQPAPNGALLAHSFPEKGSFFFGNGKYLRQPVTLRITGNKLLLSDFVLFEHPSAAPEMSSYEQRELPKMPAEITETSSWDEIDTIKIDGKRWSTRFFRYYIWNFPYEEAIQKLAAAYRELPFVAKVEIVDARDFGPGRKYLNVVSKAGDIRSPLTAWYSPDRFTDGMYYNVYDPVTFRPYPSEYIEKNLKSEFEIWKRDHAGDEVCIMNSKSGSIQIKRSKFPQRWSEIVNIIRILDSNLDRTVKSHELFLKLDSDEVPGDTIKPILNDLAGHFTRDDQLTSRGKSLESMIGIPLWSPP